MIVVIGGPTASGKSSLAIKVAKKLNAVIINGDAFQVYKGMDVGTAKTSEEEFGDILHFLFSYIEPSFEYSVKQYQQDCRSLIDYYLEKNTNIVIVGGTGLYIRSVIYDYGFIDSSVNIDIHRYNEMTNEELYSELLSIDKDSALKIHPNNRKRVLRAIQIFLEQNEKKSDIENKQLHKLIYDDVVVCSKNVDRAELYSKINDRVDEMFAKGLVNEVSSLINKYGKDCRAFSAIGYKETISYLNGEMTLEECKELIKKNTRNYAKRQVTFFKHQFDTKWIENIEDFLNEF